MLNNRHYLIFQWCMVSITFFFVALRIYLRCWLRGKWTWSDVFVVLAWLFFVNTAGILTCIIGFRYKLAADIATKDTASYNKHMSQGLKVQWAYQITYYFCVWSIKFSMLCFYNEFIKRHILPKCWVAVRVIFAVCVITLAFIFLGTLFWCQPMRLNWSVADHCEAGDHYGFEIPVIIFHMGTDMSIYILPLLCLRQMKILSLRQRFGAGLLFGVGFLSILSGASVFGIGFGTGTERAMWTLTLCCIEQSLAIIVACGPAFRSFLLWGVSGLRRSSVSKRVSTWKWIQGNGSGSSAKAGDSIITGGTMDTKGGDEKDLSMFNVVQKRPTMEDV